MTPRKSETWIEAILAAAIVAACAAFLLLI